MSEATVFANPLNTTNEATFYEPKQRFGVNLRYTEQMKDLFSSYMIERKAWLRSDDALMDEYLQQDGSRILVWFEGYLLLHPAGEPAYAWHDLADCQALLTDPVYLGQHQQVQYFTCHLTAWDTRFDGVKRFKLRQACRQFDDFYVRLLFHAQGLLNWHQHHAFCSHCGSAMRMTQAGHARVCCNLQCAKTQYPKLDPAVIFSIINRQQAEERILLARKPGWDAHRYSVIAGFVEPGETLEDSVRREAFEETGLEVEQITYVASQPWPFPDALMLGFRCTTRQQDIRLIDQELEAARWFTADEIATGIAAGTFKMPFAYSIAWHLIDRWLVEQQNDRLTKSD